MLNFLSFLQNKISKKVAGSMKLFDFSNMKKSHLEKNSVYIQSNRLSFFFFLTKPKHFSPMYNFCQVNSLLQNIQILMEPFVGNVSTSAVAY